MGSQPSTNANQRFIPYERQVNNVEPKRIPQQPQQIIVPTKTETKAQERTINVQSRTQLQPQPPPTVSWPLPPKVPLTGFQITPSNADRYKVQVPTMVNDFSAKIYQYLLFFFFYLIKTQVKHFEPKNIPKVRESHPRETSDKDWEKKIDSKIVDSAHVQSQLTARFHACFNLASSENIDAVLFNLKESQKGLDFYIRQRLAIVSDEAERVLTLIIEDTKIEQDRLLANDKIIQTKQEEFYQDWLQKYIVELNKWRSEQLAELQKYLLNNQKKIFNESQGKIRKLVEDTNRIKTLIIKEELDRIAQQSNQITDEIFFNPKETNYQHHGSESKTEVNLRIQANVGHILPGHACAKDPTN